MFIILERLLYLSKETDFWVLCHEAQKMTARSTFELVKKGLLAMRVAEMYGKMTGFNNTLKHGSVEGAFHDVTDADIDAAFDGLRVPDQHHKGLTVPGYQAEPVVQNPEAEAQQPMQPVTQEQASSVDSTLDSAPPSLDSVADKIIVDGYVINPTTKLENPGAGMRDQEAPKAYVKPEPVEDTVATPDIDAMVASYCRRLNVSGLKPLADQTDLSRVYTARMIPKEPTGKIETLGPDGEVESVEEFTLPNDVTDVIVKIVLNGSMEHYTKEGDVQQKVNEVSPGTAPTIHYKGNIIFSNGKTGPVQVMDLVPGMTLSEWLGTHYTEEVKDAEGNASYRSLALPVTQALAITKSIAEKVEGVHRTGVTHRDLKTGNVMVDDDGLANKLIDFGSFDYIGEEASNTQATPTNMSPEYVKMGLSALAEINAIKEAKLNKTKYVPKPLVTRTVSPTEDVYGVGTVLYRLLTGKKPMQDGVSEVSEKRQTGMITDDQFMYELHEKLDAAHENQTYFTKAPADVQANLDALEQENPDVYAVLRRAMHKDPNMRYSSCQEMADALGSAMSDMQQAERERRETAEQEILSDYILADVRKRDGPKPPCAPSQFGTELTL
jgi:serine/threonine protein kinase